MAQTNLLSPPPTITPATALALSQKAPLILSTKPYSSLPWPLSLLLSAETPATWTTYENLLLASLRTGDEQSARHLLDRLTWRFGSDNERVMALRGVYDEALAKDEVELKAVFDRYEEALKADPTNFALRKRRVAVLKSMGRVADAVTALTVLLENSPTDAEAWAELSELYATQGLWGQAVYCMEEVLLIMPNAWSAHAQIATLHYLSASPHSPPPSLPALSLALRHFARSVELNESYLRGYYGLKVVAKALIAVLQNAPKRGHDDEDVPPPKLETVLKLEELATGKLAEIVRRYGSGEQAWQGFDEAEVIAARELLDRDGKVER